MALRVSKAYVAKILGPYSFAEIFRYGALKVFTGAQPASANHAETGTMLGIVSANGGAWAHGDPANGIEFILQDSVVLSALLPALGVYPIAGGAAGWGRLVANEYDPGADSYDYPRIDFAIGVPGSGREWIWDDVVLVEGVRKPLRTFFYTIPPLIGVTTP